MRIDDLDQLDALTDDQLWEVAAATDNSAAIRQEAIQRWLFPDETNPDADPNDLSGGRLRELRQRATVLDNDEFEADDIEDIEEISPYFDRQGRILVAHHCLQYLIDNVDYA